MNEFKGLFLFVEMSDDTGIFKAEYFPLSEKRTVTIPFDPALSITRVSVYTAEGIAARVKQIQVEREFSGAYNCIKSEEHYAKSF